MHHRLARKWQRRLEKIQARGSPNARFVSLLQAEEKSFQKNVEVEDLASAYDTVIADLADEKFMHREALANERAGFTMMEQNMHAEARKYFDRALELYKHEWGAFAKYEWLQEKVSNLLSPGGSGESFPAAPQVVGDILLFGE